MSSKYSEDAINVGKTVRVTQQNGTTRTATVAYVNEDSTVDVIYFNDNTDADGLSTSNQNDEENEVKMSRIVLLKEFEDGTTTTATPASSQSKNKPAASNEALVLLATQLKKEAAILFDLKDFEAAYNKYQSALLTLGSQKPGVGCTVLVQEKGKKEFAFRFVPALISIVDESAHTVDVMYISSNVKAVEEEEEDVNMDRIYVLPPQTLDLSAPLQCTLHLNCGVCHLKTKKYSKAIEHASIAIAIAKYSHQKTSALGVAKKTGDRAICDVDVWVKGFWIRGKAQVALNHFKEARADAKKILKLSGHENDEKAINLLKLIDKRCDITNKKNKALVKSMSKYIGVAMNQGGGSDGGGGGGRKMEERNDFSSGGSSKMNDGGGGKMSEDKYSHK